MKTDSASASGPGSVALQFTDPYVIRRVQALGEEMYRTTGSSTDSTIIRMVKVVVAKKDEGNTGLRYFAGWIDEAQLGDLIEPANTGFFVEPSVGFEPDQQ